MNTAQSHQSKFLLSFVTALIGVALLGWIGYSIWHTNEKNRHIEEWVRNYPTNAMVLEKHPNTYPRFLQHFQPYYSSAGKEGLSLGQLEMQQIMNVNYLTDYIWSVKDAELRKFLMAAFRVVSGLSEKNGGQPGLCEQYFGNSAYYSQVDATLGSGIFKDYMGASEKLFLSAKNNVQYPINPQNPGYFRFVNSSQSRFWQMYRRAYPKLTYDQLQAEAQNFDPLRSCAGYARYLRVLLLLDDTTMSMMWRSAMESDRPRWEAIRRWQGSE